VGWFRQYLFGGYWFAPQAPHYQKSFVYKIKHSQRGPTGAQAGYPCKSGEVPPHFDKSGSTRKECSIRASDVQSLQCELTIEPRAQLIGIAPRGVYPVDRVTASRLPVGGNFAIAKRATAVKVNRTGRTIR
jgi:hypothetical protein